MKQLALVVLLFISITSTAQKNTISTKDSTYIIASLPNDDRATLEDIYGEIISFEKYIIKQNTFYSEFDTINQLAHIPFKEEIEENMQIFIRKLEKIAKNQHIKFDKDERFGYIIKKNKNKNNTEHVMRLCLDKINEISNQ